MPPPPSADEPPRSLFSKLWAKATGGSPQLQQPPQPGGTSGRAGIHPWLGVGERLSAEVSADGRVLAQFEHTAVHPGLSKRPTVEIALPDGLRKLRLRGTLTASDGGIARFDRSWTVRDLSVHTCALYDRERPLAERVRTFADATGLARFAPADPAADADTAFAQAEQRLGLRLPTALRELLSAGEIEIEHSYFVAPQRLRSAAELLLGEGGHADLDAVPAAVRARYQRSVVAFVEIGDGLGALAWDPAGAVAGEASGRGGAAGDAGAQPGEPGQGLWYWLHQGHIDEPALLLDDGDRPRAHEAALIHPFQRLAMSPIDDRESDDELIVDSAHPRNLLQLHFEAPRKPQLWLRSYDYFFSLY